MKRLSKKKTSLIFCLFFIIWLTFIIPLGVKFVQKRYIYPKKYEKIVESNSYKFSVDENLIFATIKVESNFNEKAVSSAGAIGLMQIMPKTAEFIAKNLGENSSYDLTDYKTNIKFGVYYLSYLLKKFPLKATAICAYNAGEGIVSNWLKDSRYSRDGKSLEYIPYKETREYLVKILSTEKKYEKLYAKSVDK